MDSVEFPITVTAEDYGFNGEELTFRYTEKEDSDQKVERYQVSDEFGIVFSGEKIWRTEEEKRFLGLWTEENEVYEEDIQKRVGYSKNAQSVITERSDWEEFRDFLRGTEAEKYLE